MDGRTAVATTLFGTIACWTAACSSGPATKVAPADGAGTEQATSTPERPAVAEILADGRFRFRSGGPGLRRELEAGIERDPALQEAVKKLAVKIVIDPTEQRDPMYVVAIVFAEPDVQSAIWDGFVRSIEEQAGRDLEEEGLAGATTLYAKGRGEQMLAIDYADDLLIRLGAKPSTPREDMEALALQLLKARG